MIKRMVKLVPNFIKSALYKLYYFPIDVIYQLKGNDNMIPPRSMNFIGNGDFKETGEEFKKYFVELINLKPSDQVLDVGCGLGRMAIPLTDYLSKEGEYWGIDIVNKGIEWCQSHISPKFSNFHFQYCDVYNNHYNPKGKVQAQRFEFPFPNEFFDFIYLTSVFTHMLPSDMENYLTEISRTLKVGGKTLISFFILNEESERLVTSGHSSINFIHRMQGYLTSNKKDPEEAIAYSEEVLLRLFEENGFMISRPIHYGSWCGRDNFLSYQDLVIAQKMPKKTTLSVGGPESFQKASPHVKSK